MTDEEKQKLFQEFFRVKNEKTKHITGSGLGLSIAKRVIDLYKGKINVDTEPDKGTTFYVQLPIKSDG
jgi:signal transduction histidine kinase